MVDPSCGRFIPLVPHDPRFSSSPSPLDFFFDTTLCGRLALLSFPVGGDFSLGLDFEFGVRLVIICRGVAAFGVAGQTSGLKSDSRAVGSVFIAQLWVEPWLSDSICLEKSTGLWTVNVPRLLGRRGVLIRGGGGRTGTFLVKETVDNDCDPLHCTDSLPSILSVISTANFFA